MWKEVLDNPKAIEMFDPEPSLEDVILSRVVVERDGPTVTMSIQLRDYPNPPPLKWGLREYNAVTVEMQAMGVENVKLLGWSTENQVSILIERSSEGTLQVRALGVQTNLEFRCGWLRILGVSPYRRVEQV